MKLQSGVTGHEVRVVDEQSLDDRKSNIWKRLPYSHDFIANCMLVINCNVN